MGIEHRKHNDAVDVVLKALNDAPPPDGMEARIAQRLQRAKASAAADFHWRGLFSGSTLAAAWWRGAVSGAAAAMLIGSTLLLANHLLRPHAGPAQTTATNLAVPNSARAATPIQVSANSAPKHESSAVLCANPRLLRAHSVVPVRPTDPLRAESYAENDAPSHPAPVMPLTAEERALVRLAKTADAKDLGTLDPQTEAKLEEQDAAAFKQFFASLFTPPPAPPVTETNE